MIRYLQTSLQIRQNNFHIYTQISSRTPWMLTNQNASGLRPWTTTLHHDSDEPPLCGYGPLYTRFENHRPAGFGEDF